MNNTFANPITMIAATALTNLVIGAWMHAVATRLVGQTRLSLPATMQGLSGRI